MMKRATNYRTWGIFLILLALLAMTLIFQGEAVQARFRRIDEPNVEPIAACTNSIEFGFGLDAGSGNGGVDLLWGSPEAPSSLEVTATVRILDTGQVVAISSFTADILKPDPLIVTAELNPDPLINPQEVTYYWAKTGMDGNDPDYAGGTLPHNGNVVITWGEHVPVGSQLQVVVSTSYTYTGSFNAGQLLFGPAAYPDNGVFTEMEEFKAQDCRTITRTFLPYVQKGADPSPPVVGLPIDEGFESGLVPPSGWMQVQTNPRDTWKINQISGPYSGSFAADCEYDDQLAQQNEVLLSPGFQASSAQLQFYSFGSLHWCRDTYDNCDLNVWLVVGEWGGLDDVLLRTADDDWTDTWAWSPSSIDLTPYLPPETPVRIAFQYEGQDGAQIGLDAVSVTQGGALGAGVALPAPGPNGWSESQSRVWEDGAGQ